MAGAGGEGSLSRRGGMAGVAMALATKNKAVTTEHCQ